MENGKKKFYDIGILICACLFSACIPFSSFIDNELISLICTISLRIIFFIFFIIYTKKYHLALPKFKKLKFKFLLFLPFLILPFSNLIYCLITKANKVSDFNSISLIYESILCLFVAIAEEITFRGVIVSELKTKYNSFKIILFSSLIFGLVHLLNISSLSSILPSIIQVFYAFFLGLFLSFIYLLSNNIILPILLHFTFNFFNNSLVTMLYELEWDFAYFAINIGIGLLLLAYGLLLYFKVFKEELKCYPKS